MNAQARAASRRGVVTQWQRRRVISALLRTAIVVLPVAVSFVVALLLSWSLPHPDSVSAAILWVALVVLMAVLVLVVLQRVARRLLPLAALLNVAMVFPDAAPRRFAVARLRGSPRELQLRLRRAHEAGDADGVARLQTITELVLALSVHDRATRGHSERVRVFTELIADEMKISEPDRARLRWAAILHDIGKLEVPPATLNKKTRPTDEEWVALHLHPEEGARLVGPLLPWLAEWGAAVEQHHERFDGTGYPHGLQGHEIALAARIVAVADSYEVMTAPRSYKRPMGVVAARRELVRVAATQLDPEVVRAFLNISVGRLWWVIGIGAWVAQAPLFGPLIPRFGDWATRTAAAASVGALVAFGGLTVAAVPGGVLGLSTVPGTSAAAPGGTSHGPGGRGAGGPTAPIPGTQPGASAQPGGSPAGPGSTVPTPAATFQPAAGAAGGTFVTGPLPGGSGGTGWGGTGSGGTGSGGTGSGGTGSGGTGTGGGGTGSGGSGGGGGQGTGGGSAPPPTPGPGPWTCTGCTNDQPGCTSHCKGNTGNTCASYCDGNNLVACTTYCFGNNNRVCTGYCDGNNNPRCVSNCDGNNNPRCVSGCQGKHNAGAVAATFTATRWSVPPQLTA